MPVIVSPAIAHVLAGNPPPPPTAEDLMRVLLATSIGLCAAWVKWKLDARRKSKEPPRKTRR